MARCEQGYLCEVCGEEVEEIAESDLYLRYVLGEVDPEQLHRLPERHIRCNPALGQFIVADDFPPLNVEGAFAKSDLDPQFVAQEEKRVTRGYRRLRQLERLSLPILEYPLPEVRQRWLRGNETQTSASPTAQATTPTPESNPQILFLDDDPARARDFLRRHPEAVWVETAPECIARLSEEWDQVHLDHDLGGEIYVDSCRPDCGMEVVRWLCAEPRSHMNKTLFIIHTLNADAANSMLTCLRDKDYQAVYRPFGVDIYDSYAEEEPGEELEVDVAGPPPPHRTSWTDRLRQLWRRF
jgi:Cyclic-phosphate processing Receiver domain